MRNVYLDYAAATPVSKAVARAMEPYFSELFYNPSALYSGALEVKHALEEARSSVASNLGSRPSEIIFTAGGTESANLAIRGVMEYFPDSELIISAVEHDAVRKPAQLYATKECPVDSKGRVDLDALKSLITDKTVLISVMYANNEVGTVQPIKDLAEIVKEARRARAKKKNKLPLYVHIDACQAPQYLDVNTARLGVDLMTINGGKMYGPKQSGILYRKAGVLLSPQILGGGQEFGIRSGTENIASSVGFATALQVATRRRNSTNKLTSDLGKYFMDELESRFKAVINGSKKKRLANNIHATFLGTDNERMLFSLNQQGVWAANGSACSASSEEASHVLLAMGLGEAHARSSLRFSIGRETTKEDIDYALKALEVAIKA